MWQLFGIDLGEVIVYYQQPDITMDSDIDFRLQTFLGPIESTLADFAKAREQAVPPFQRLLLCFPGRLQPLGRDRYFFG